MNPFRKKEYAVDRIAYFKKSLDTMSNEDLFSKLVEIANGDDYDGGFTGEGKMKMSLMLEEFIKRAKQKRLFEKDFDAESIKDMFSLPS